MIGRKIQLHIDQSAELLSTLVLLGLQYHAEYKTDSLRHIVLDRYDECLN